MMKNIFRALLLFVSCLMLACTDLDELISGDDVHSAILRFEGSIEGYDVKTRATTSVWPDGARIYIQYQTANGVTNGSAVYSSSSDTWTVTYSGTLTQGKAMSCSVYYFEDPSSMTATYAILNAHSASYADAEASYFFEDGTITIQGILKPLLGRIRFKGTAGTSFTLSGLKWYTGYSNASNSLSQQSGTLSLTVGSNGYTPYVYTQFADASTRKLTLISGENEYAKTFSSNVLAAGRSGYVNIPTASSKEGWTGGTDEELFGLCPDNNHPHAIDLGLGVKFACCNVGADSPIGYGDYYAWGETAMKSNYDWNTYKWCNGSSTSMTKYCNNSAYGVVDNKTILELSDDAARVNWEGSWRMPTITELKNLFRNCTYTWTTLDNVSGFMIKAPNGNRIFLPASGSRSNENLSDVGSKGLYWSSSFHDLNPHCGSVISFYNNSSGYGTGVAIRCLGLCVRPVYDQKDDDPLSFCPDNNHPHAIDLGIGVKFACCNVGASTPIDCGNFYAWGETSIKNENNYDWSTYKWCQGAEKSLTKYCSDSDYGIVDNKRQLELSDDVASVSWGGGWRLPSIVELRELYSKCTWAWYSNSYVNGYIVTASNGNRLFLPAAGHHYLEIFYDWGTDGYYWTNTLSESSHSQYADVLSFSCRKVQDSGFSSARYCGLSARPVYGNDNSNRITITANGVSFNMIKVYGGTFQMGGNGEGDDEYYGRPIHQVTLTNDYYIGETEVTQELWTAVMGSNPSYFTSSNRLPVEKVSWKDCQTFITKLNELTGKTFRLPTEAEWEFAARGGNASQGYIYSGSNSIGDVAWYDGNSSSQTHEVATKAPNELGIYDMSGNVMEWCQDWYGSYSSEAQTNPTGPTSGSYRVIRGGSGFQYDDCCRVAYRRWNSAWLSFIEYGLRLAI